MVRINRVYTGNGDQGETHLADGTKVAKDALRVEAYGDVDELNSVLGLARTLADKYGRSRTSAGLCTLQNELFDAGAELASARDAGPRQIRFVGQDETRRIESEIDGMVAELPELRSFVLPGGSEINAVLHMARTVCRRAERSIVRLSHQENVRPELLIYFNRLGDLLFVLARTEAAAQGAAEYLWNPRSAQ